MRSLPLALLALVLLTASAFAATPDPSISEVHCGASSPTGSLVTCPDGDWSTVGVYVIDTTGHPMAFSAVVELDFSSCPGFTMCAPDGSERYTWDPVARVARMGTDYAGTAFFFLRAGGLCPGASIPVRANGVLLATRTLASFDQNGDLVVDAGDAAIVSSKVGTIDPTADFTCDGAVTAGDLSFLQSSHLGHKCDLATRSRDRSWGEMKIIYR